MVPGVFILVALRGLTICLHCIRTVLAPYLLRSKYGPDTFRLQSDFGGIEHYPFRMSNSMRILLKNPCYYNLLSIFASPIFRQIGK